MNQKIKEKWVKALRSGKYKQGTCLLKRKGNKFCCLGVLCDLYAKEKKVKWRKNSTGNSEIYDAMAMPPRKIMDWAELPNTGIKLFGEVISLTILNDSKSTPLHPSNIGLNFNQIADLIEHQL